MRSISSKNTATSTATLSKPFFSKPGKKSNQAEKPFFGPSTIQPKLSIGQPGDTYEQEADAMANQVMRMSEGPINDGETIQAKPLPVVQRKCDACEEEEVQTKPALMKSEGNGSKATAALSSQLNTSKGSGAPLAESTNNFMNSAFGTDFSKVRVHTGGNAIQMNQGLNARAFAHGSDIYFNQGEYAPGTSEGKRLLAHELTHVVQQTGGADVGLKRAKIPFMTATRRTLIQRVDEATDWSGRYMGNRESGDRYTVLELNVNGERLSGRYWVDQGGATHRNRVETGVVEGFLDIDGTYEIRILQRYDRANGVRLEELTGTVQFREGNGATSTTVTLDGLGIQSYVRVRAGTRAVSNPLGDATGLAADAPQEVTHAMADELTPEKQAELGRKAEEVALAINDQFGDFTASPGVAVIGAGPILEVHRRVVDEFDGPRGERIVRHFMTELATHRVRYRGENVRADWALRELIGLARSHGRAAYVPEEVHRYRLEFVGLSADAAAVLGLGGSTLTMTVTKLAPNDWSEQSYTYLVGTVRLTATAGASGGSSAERVVKTVETNSDWTPEDFAWAWVRGVEAAGPRGTLNAGPLHASGGLFKASMLSLVANGRQPIQIDLDGELHFTSQNITEDEQDLRTEGGVGGELTYGSIGIEIGRTVPLPSTEYPGEDLRHQPNQRAVNIEVPTQQYRTAFELASATLGQHGATELLRYLTAWQPLVADRSVEIRIDGRADLFWSGRGTADDLYPGEAGNADLSRRRAGAVARAIQSFVANLPAPADGSPRAVDRPVQVRGLGAGRHLAQYLQHGTLEDLDTRSADIADPNHRVVEVSVAGARPLVLRYSE